VDASARLFRRFKAWGFDSVEIPVEELGHIRPEFIKKQLAGNDLACAAVCACMGPGRDLRGTARQQQTAMAYLNGLLEITAMMGVRSMVGPLYSVTGRAEAVGRSEYRQQWRAVCRHLKELCRRAEELRIQICIEPLNRFETDFINTCQQALTLIEDVGSPALKVHLDTFHMNIEEKDPAAAIRLAGPHLGQVHACGSDRGTPGKDRTDWRAIATALKEIDYRGEVVIESFTQDVAVIARAAAIWRRIEPTRNEIAIDGLKFLREALA